MNAPIKIKLGAIARDEAAYLPEWIFHHFQFGVDAIEIYVNNTQDNSLAVLKNIAKHFPVEIKQADELFKSCDDDFQFKAYERMAEKAQAQGFSHMIFLDIDEFWTPVDFKTSMKQCIEKITDAHAICFNWLLHCDEGEFSPCFKPAIKIKPNPHVKSLFQLAAPREKIAIHNIIGNKILYCKGNGQAYDFAGSPHCGLTDMPALDHDYYIVHRMYRSQMEYVSLLGRGRANKIKLKDNRNGYYVNTDKLPSLHFDIKKLEEHYLQYQAFIERCDLRSAINDAQLFVHKRHKKVLRLAEKAKNEQAATFLSLFNHVSGTDIMPIKAKLKSTISFNNFKSDDLIHHTSAKYLLLILFAKLLTKMKLHGWAKKWLYTFATTREASTSDYSKQVVDGVVQSLVLSNVNSKNHADVLRDIAIHLYKNNQLNLAFYFIKAAKKARPKGPYINQLHDSMHKDLLQSK